MHDKNRLEEKENQHLFIMVQLIVSECFLSPKAWALNEPQRQKKASTFPTDVRQSARDNGDSAFALMVVVVFNWVWPSSTFISHCDSLTPHSDPISLSL